MWELKLVTITNFCLMAYSFQSASLLSYVILLFYRKDLSDSHALNIRFVAVVLSDLMGFFILISLQKAQHLYSEFVDKPCYADGSRPSRSSVSAHYIHSAIICFTLIFSVIIPISSLIVHCFFQPVLTAKSLPKQDHSPRKSDRFLAFNNTSILVCGITFTRFSKSKHMQESRSACHMRMTPSGMDKSLHAALRPKLCL